MSGVLDQIRKVVIVPTPETVTTDWATEAASLDDRDGAFSLYIKYANGSGVNMTVWLQMSVNGTDWANVPDTDEVITDNSGMVIYDVDGSGTQYVRIAIVVTAGSIDVTEGLYSASQWH